VKPTVLVVDDEAAVRYTLRSILEEEDIAVVEASDGAEALEIVDRGGVDLVLTDLRMPRMDGMELLSELALRPGAPRVIMITAYGSERLAVEAIKRGALDYFAKPFEAEEIVRVVSRSLETVRLSAENRALRAELALRKLMIFESAAMRRVADVVERVASRDVTVLISGESGTGKELVARAIVKASRRAKAPFVQFNCAALPRELAEAELFGHSRGAFTGAARARVGLFCSAEGGTLLLDEVGELDLVTQGKLLRALQEREVRPVGEDHPVRVDVRILAATNRDLGEAVRAGSFRQDLYYRLNVVGLHLPPLAERRDDVPLLAYYFLKKHAALMNKPVSDISPEAMALLAGYDYPGNVRELANLIERGVALASGPVLEPAHLPETLRSVRTKVVRPAGGSFSTLEAQEADYIRQVLQHTRGNRTHAAQILGIDRVSLWRKLKRYGLGE